MKYMLESVWPTGYIARSFELSKELAEAWKHYHEKEYPTVPVRILEVEETSAEAQNEDIHTEA